MILGDVKPPKLEPYGLTLWVGIIIAIFLIGGFIYLAKKFGLI